MRGLTKRQKELLNLYEGANHVDDLSTSVWEDLEEMNDYETLYQDTSRYLYDNYIQNKMKKDW